MRISDYHIIKYPNPKNPEKTERHSIYGDISEFAEENDIDLNTITEMQNDYHIDEIIEITDAILEDNNKHNAFYTASCLHDICKASGLNNDQTKTFLTKYMEHIDKTFAY